MDVQNLSKNIGLGTKIVRKKILDYFYAAQINTNQKFNPITCQADLDYIKNGDYIICTNFIGVRSIILFFKMQETYYAVFFPKNSIHDNIKILPIQLKISPKLYLGTILEGIYYKFDGKNYLIIDEVYRLNGEDQISKPKDDRLSILTEIIKTNIICDDNYNIHFFASLYFKKTENDFETIFKIIKADPNINELIFYPKLYNGKIYTYTIQKSDYNDIVFDFAIFTMDQTDQTDVYNLYDKSNHIGIAYIPDIETSKKCRQWFKNSNIKNLDVKCQLNTEMGQWVPTELIQ